MCRREREKEGGEGGSERGREAREGGREREVREGGREGGRRGREGERGR